MGLAYAIVVQDLDGADWNEHVSTRRGMAAGVFQKLKLELEGDGNMNQVRYEVWKDGDLVPEMTQIHFVNVKDDEEEEEEEEEDEDYEG